MQSCAPRRDFRGGGICVVESTKQPSCRIASEIHDWVSRKGMSDWVCLEQSTVGNGRRTQFELTQEKFDEWTPSGDTLELAKRLSESNQSQYTLEAEILIAMLASPIAFLFPSIQELESHIRIRRNIVEAAAKTYLSFAAYEAERPPEFWEYDSNRGFVVREGKSIIEALKKATQPADTDSAFSFSCYRATEYVVSLGLAKEARRCNPELLNRLQQQAETRAIKSGEFHEVFMKEYGSRENPLPSRYYVPGDRVWFRNPDEASSDAMGFEGSWVFYQGAGLFSDFWKRNRAFTFQSKCLEIFHWRNAMSRDENGRLKIDESSVQSRIQSSLRNPAELNQIMCTMDKLQDPRGVYADGGCVDPTREYPKWVQPNTTDIVLPDVTNSKKIAALSDPIET